MSAYLNYLKYPALISSSLIAAASGALYWKQNELIYPRYLPAGARTEEGVPKPTQFGISDYEDVRFTTPDSETLCAYFIRPANKGLARPITILMFHGNAGNIGHRVPIAKVLEENAGCNVFMAEYRGYGLSSGVPNERGLMIDAQAALDYIRQHEEMKSTKIVVYGQSLGGAVSIQLVARNQQAGDVVGLILENTFTSIKNMIPNAFPPAKYLVGLCHEYWPSEDTLPQITEMPVLFLSGLKDEIVPPSHMRTLRSVCKSKDVTWREIPNGDHNSSVAEPYYFNYIIDFVDKICPRKAGRL